MRKAIQAVTGLGVAAALAFGALQATATPAAAAPEAGACNAATCGTACFAKGYTHWACWNGNCQCSFGPRP